MRRLTPTLVAAALLVGCPAEEPAAGDVAATAEVDGPGGDTPGTAGEETVETAGGDDDVTPDVPPDAPDVPPQPCESDKDCPQALCDPLSGECVGCLFDLDCPDGEVCSGALECAPEQCIQDEDCAGQAHCVESLCEPFTECASSKDCTGLVCDKSIGECVDCEADADCAEGALCKESECVELVACDSDKDCTPLGMLCDKSGGECVDCLEHADCPDVYYCKDKSCTVDQCIAGQTVCDEDKIVACSASGSGFTPPQPCGAGKTCVQDGFVAQCKDVGD